MEHIRLILPEQFGMERCKKEDLVGGTPQENAQITRDILNGVTGPKMNAVLLNAGAGLYIGGKAENLEKGIDLARKLINDDCAKNKLEQFIQESNS